MKLLKSETGKVSVEFSSSEFLTLTGIVYTANLDFDNLDATFYELEEAEVSGFAKQIEAIQTEAARQREADKCSSTK